MLYKIQKLDLATRKAFARVLYGIDLLEEPIADKVITAWATTVAASEYPTLDKVPWDAADIKYTLLEHVNEVTKAGSTLPSLRQSSGITSLTTTS